MKVELKNPSARELIYDWFRLRKWKPFPYQEEVWDSFRKGESGLLNLPTGAGKTYAAFMGPLEDIIENGGAGKGLQILYLTPLRAVSRDIEKALKLPIDELGLKLRVESRTGDTSSSLRAKQRKSLPEILITTPESLQLLIANENWRENFKNLRSVIIDEWHELLGSKRGNQVELGVARLSALKPELRIWTLSATLRNLDEAAEIAVLPIRKPKIIAPKFSRPIAITSLIPQNIDTFPWAGHLGIKLLPELIQFLDPEFSTLLFANTRSQAELWRKKIIDSRPEWDEITALHHSSIDREEREKIEEGLKSGKLRFVVATSSLDLGVDFAPVERVVQIGSVKGIGRLLQRAGRASHRPFEECRILFLPTHALELLEVAALREALSYGEIESRKPLMKPIDVLLQHLVTVAIGGGFTPDQMFDEIRTTYSYRDLHREEFDWAVRSLRNREGALRAYPDYAKIEEVDGVFRVTNKRIAQLHRMNIGTIASDPSIKVQFLRGKPIGFVEESYIARLKPKESFLFAGKMLEVVMVRDLVAYVRMARGNSTNTPRWMGGRFPLSADLSKALRRILEESKTVDLVYPEVQALKPILEAQQRISEIPNEGELLAEILQARDGHHLFLYPFEGRLVNEALAALIAYRMAKIQPSTFSLAANDYGIHFHSPSEFPFEEVLKPELFSSEHLLEDIHGSINLSELSKRQFREIARVAGLTFTNYPGGAKSHRQVMASSSLLFEVFKQYDPENRLLTQSEREVLERQFEGSRLLEALQRLSKSKILFKRVSRPSPIGFPLLVEILQARLTNESLEERVERMKKRWEKSKF